MHIESTSGQRTSSESVLPAADARLPQPTTQSAPVGGWKGSGRVLLVDDDTAVRATCRLLLERLGFEVQAADNGREALEFVLKNDGNYRFVCMDMQMPEMSGRDALRAMRARFPTLPIIIMSGYAGDLDGGLFGDQQPTAFLHKPFSKLDLATLLSRILG